MMEWGNPMESIHDYEESLRQAMLTSDVEALDRLIADDLLFVTHFGQIIGKADDLNAHRQKLFTLSRLDFLKQEVRQLGDAFITVTVAELDGVFSNETFTDRIIYTRVWRKNGDGALQVCAGQATRG